MTRCNFQMWSKFQKLIPFFIDRFRFRQVPSSEWPFGNMRIFERERFGPSKHPLLICGTLFHANKKIWYNCQPPRLASNHIWLKFFYFSRAPSWVSNGKNWHPVNVFSCQCVRWIWSFLAYGAYHDCNQLCLNISARILLEVRYWTFELSSKLLPIQCLYWDVFFVVFHRSRMLAHASIHLQSLLGISHFCQYVCVAQF